MHKSHAALAFHFLAALGERENEKTEKCEEVKSWKLRMDEIVL